MAERDCPGFAALHELGFEDEAERWAAEPAHGIDEKLMAFGFGR
ncbi:hypothetical protein [Halovibrio salipaludis]|jgi:hypothetical protein|nr:hypothetical protein [Halovibrio salipaludis]